MSTITPSKTAHAALWSIAEISIRFGVQLLTMALLARLLEPRDFGLIAMLLVFVNVGVVLTDGGFGAALVRAEPSPDNETTAFLCNIGVSLASAIALWAIAPQIAIFYGEPKLVELTSAVAWVLPLGAIGSVADALLIRRLEFRTRAHSQLVASTISGALAAYLAWTGFGVWSLIAQLLVAAGLRSALLCLLSGWRPRGRPRVREFKQLFSFGGFILLAGLLNTASSQIQSVMVGRVFSARILGFYSLAENIVQGPRTLIQGVLHRIGFPVFSSLRDEPDRLRSSLRSALKFSLFITTPLMVFLALFARPLIIMFLGEKWAPSALLVSLLALAGALWPIHVLNLAALNAQGWSGRALYLEVLKNAVLISTTLLAAPHGVVAIAASVLLSGLLCTILNTWYSHKMLAYGLLRQLADQKETFLLVAIASTPALLMIIARLSDPWQVAAICISSSILYATAAKFTGHESWQQLQDLARQFFSRPVTP